MNVIIVGNKNKNKKSHIYEKRVKKIIEFHKKKKQTKKLLLSNKLTKKKTKQTASKNKKAKQHKYQRAFLRVKTRPAKNTQQTKNINQD